MPKNYAKVTVTENGVAKEALLRRHGMINSSLIINGEEGSRSISNTLISGLPQRKYPTISFMDNGVEFTAELRRHGMQKSRVLVSGESEIRQIPTCWITNLPEREAQVKLAPAVPAKAVELVEDTIQLAQELSQVGQETEQLDMV